MTRSFQSLRQLMNRVFGNNSNGADASVYEYSTLRIENSEAESQAESPDIELQTADTQRLPQVNPEFMSHQNGNALHHESEDSLLDLDGVHGSSTFAHDPILELDLDSAPQFCGKDGDHASPNGLRTSSIAIQPEPAFADTETDLMRSVESRPVSEKVDAPSVYHSDMSSDAIDEIARRVVEQLSEKVVREIAWEVVPELSELLIKQKLQAR